MTNSADLKAILISHDLESILELSRRGIVTISGLLNILKQNDEEELRIMALKALFHIDRLIASQIAGIILRDAKPSLHFKIRNMIVEIGIHDPNFVLDLLSNEDLLLTSLGILRDFPDKRSVEPLVKLLELEKRADICIAVINTLGEMADNKASNILVKNLRSKDINIRFAAADALGKIADIETLEPLQFCLKAESNSSVIYKCIFAILKIDQRYVSEYLPVLEKLLHSEIVDDEVWVKQNIVDEMGILKYPEFGPLLLHMLNDKSDLVRLYAIYSLGEIGSLEALPSITARLGDNDPKIRAAAAEVLGKLGDPRAIDGLLALLTDDNEEVRKQALDSLENIGGDKTLKSLVQLRDKHHMLNPSELEQAIYRLTQNHSKI